MFSARDYPLPHLECRYLDATRGKTWDVMEPVYLKETASGAAPRQATWFKAAWDEKALRVVFHAEDTDPWATLTEHDAPLYREEVVEVFLDPTGDLECYFEIEVNPLNAVCDLVLRRTRCGYRKDFGWHCPGLKTAVTRQPGFWTAEMVIPFADIAAGTPACGDQWRGNFLRIDRPKNEPRELSAWSPTGCPMFHVQDRFGVLEFIR